jgi:fibronectin type III domain protein
MSRQPWIPRIITAVVSLALASSLAQPVSPAAAPPTTTSCSVTGTAGETVTPIVINFGTLSAAAVAARRQAEVPEGELPAGLSLLPPAQIAPGGYFLLQAGGIQALNAPTPSTNFEGITYQGYFPSEPTVAVGPNHILSIGNVSVVIASKNGTGRVEKSNTSFFAAGESPVFDPLCQYDPTSGRFFVLGITTDRTNYSYCYLNVSQTSDPTGLWWRYKFDWRKDGTAITSFWADFPGLGMCSDKLAITSRQYQHVTNPVPADYYQYEKIGVIDKSRAISGLTVTRYDFWNFGGSFATKPGRCLTSSNRIELLATQAGGGSGVIYRRLEGLYGSLCLSTATFIPVSSYGAVVNAPQIATNPDGRINVGDCRTPEFTVRSDVATIAWHFGGVLPGETQATDLIRVLKLRTNDDGTAAVISDENYGAPGQFYFFPSAVEDPAGTLYLGYGTSSATQYLSSYVTGKRASDSVIQPSVLLKGGTAFYTAPNPDNPGRWGDYTGIAIDETAVVGNSSSAWYSGQWTKGSSTWGTWIDKLSYSYGVISGRILADADGNMATSGDRTPFAGAIVNLEQGGQVVTSATSDASGNVSFVGLNPGTYVVEGPLSGVLGQPDALDVIPGSGGTSQTRLNSNQIQIALTEVQSSSNNQFVVTTRAHLFTSTSGATWTATQRRIAQDFDWVGPTDHAVYESGGSIWHLRNRRNAGWELEQLLSAGSTTASAPSITTHTWGHEDQIQVYVAWLEPYGTIMYRASNVDNGVTWNPPVALPIGFDASTPLLPDPYGLLWAEGPAGGAGIYWYKQPLTNDSWWPQLIPGTAGNVSLPAVWAYGACTYELAFIRDGKVYVEGFADNDPNPYTAPTLCASAVDVTTAGWTATNPAIASTGTSLFVAWEEASGPDRRIAFKERTGGTWAPALYFTHSTHVPTKPVLGIESSSNTLNLLWQCGDHIARVSRPVSGSVWTPLADVGPGGAPSIVDRSSYKATAMWTSGTTAPYSIVFKDDLTPPDAISNLQPDVVGPNDFTVLWTAPGDDGSVGTAQAYDLRIATFDITESNFASAIPANPMPVPQAAGTTQSYTFTGLSACTSYRVAIKARDDAGSWSPLSNVLTVATVCSGGGGGCPVADVLTESGWVMDNTVLSRSRDGSMSTQYQRLRTPVAPRDGRYQVRLRENGHDVSRIDRLALMAVDHAPDDKAFVVDGTPVAGRVAPPASVMTADGRDVTDLLAAEDGREFHGQPGDVLYLEWRANGFKGVFVTSPRRKDVLRSKPDPRDQRAVPAARSLDAQILDETGYVIEAETSPGQWRSVAHGYPRDQLEQVAFSGPLAKRYRITFVGTHDMDFCGAFLPSEGVVHAPIAAALAAVHTSDGAITSALAKVDGAVATLSAPDTIRLSFTLPPVPEGLSRDLFLVSHGVYSSPTEWHETATRSLPTAFALAQNQPNPFARTTTISFDLPVATSVRLEVFDLSGRRVAALADRAFPAGRHSVPWNRSSVRPGVYVYRMTSPLFSANRKMVVLP